MVPGSKSANPMEAVTAQAPAPPSLLLLLDALDALESCNALDASVIFCGFIILSYRYKLLSPTNQAQTVSKNTQAALGLYYEGNGHGMRKLHAWWDVFSNPQFHDGWKLIAVNPSMSAQPQQTP